MTRFRRPASKLIMPRSIFSIVGARPQFIKAAVLSRAVREEPSLVESIVHSGQHFDLNMSDVFFQELQIPAPEFHLNIRAARHGAMTGRMLEALESLFIERKPDLVVVFGDTNTTLAGALAAAKLGIPLAHVEAGMRAYEPIPEEINRVVTDHVANLHFSVNSRSTAALLREGVSANSIVEVGDVMFDCAMAWSSIAMQRSTILAQLGYHDRQYALCTVHRAANADDPGRLSILFRGLLRLSQSLPVVVPIHPRTRHSLEGMGMIDHLPPGVRLIDPVGYLDMVRLERSAALVLTDSGGVQREAFFHKVPCVTFRNETEWPELVESGWNRLVALDDPARFAAEALSRVGSAGQAIDSFGDGRAATRIARTLAAF